MSTGYVLLIELAAFLIGYGCGTQNEGVLAVGVAIAVLTCGVGMARGADGR